MSDLFLKVSFQSQKIAHLEEIMEAAGTVHSSKCPRTLKSINVIAFSRLFQNPVKT
jgi:hypothetical protein